MNNVTMTSIWNALQQPIIWESLLLALGLWWLRSRVGRGRMGQVLQHTLTLASALAFVYALISFVFQLLSISITNALTLGSRVLIILIVAYLSWEGVEILTVYVLSHVPLADERERRRVETLSSVVRWAGRSLVAFITGAMLLDVFDVNVTPLVASAGVIGLALGLGSQKLVQDLIAGLFILLEDQFHVGDGVEIAGIAGAVEEMTLRVTKVRDFNGVLHIIPNSAITTVSNKTRDWARAIAEVGVAYDSDLGKVMEVLEQVGQALYEENPDEMFLEQPFPLGPEALADSSINFRLVAKVKAGQQWSAQRLMRRRIKEAFDEAGIEIPFPQLDVHMKNA